MMKALLVGVALIAATGCATTRAGDSAPRRTAEDYYPLAVGNRWTYEMSRLGEKREETIEVVRVEDGYFVDNLGAKLTIDAYGVRDEKRYLLQEPIQQDHAWKNTVSVQITERYKILSVGALCESPAGQFSDCVTVSSTVKVGPDAELINDLTFARGVGLVRLEVDLQQAGKRTPQHRMALKAFSLAKPAEGAAR